jgi:hypothetical protein
MTTGDAGSTSSKLVEPVLGVDECREHLDVPDRQVDEGGIQAT